MCERHMHHVIDHHLIFKLIYNLLERKKKQKKRKTREQNYRWKDVESIRYVQTIARVSPPSYLLEVSDYYSEVPSCSQ